MGYKQPPDRSFICRNSRLPVGLRGMCEESVDLEWKCSVKGHLYGDTASPFN